MSKQQVNITPFVIQVLTLPEASKILTAAAPKQQAVLVTLDIPETAHTRLKKKVRYATAETTIREANKKRIDQAVAFNIRVILERAVRFKLRHIYLISTKSTTIANGIACAIATVCKQPEYHETLKTYDKHAYKLTLAELRCVSDRVTYTLASMPYQATQLAD